MPFFHFFSIHSPRNYLSKEHLRQRIITVVLNLDHDSTLLSREAPETRALIRSRARTAIEARLRTHGKAAFDFLVFDFGPEVVEGPGAEDAS